jgi:O-antigen ligase
MVRLRYVRIELCLFNVILGASLALVPWLMNNLFKITSFEIENIRASVYLGSSGFRYAIAKQDPNAITILLNIVFWGAVNMFLWEYFGKRIRLGILLLFLSIFALPSIIDSESRGGFIVFTLTLVITTIVWYLARKHLSDEQKENLTQKARSQGRGYIKKSDVVLGIIIILIGTILLGIDNTRKVDWKNRIDNTIYALKEKGLDDRAIRFKEAWEIIRKSPVSGVGTKEFIASNFGNAPHNTFLDIGIGAGLPGIVLFALVVFMPLYFQLTRRKTIESINNVNTVCYFVIISSMMSLSMVGDKLFWVFWSFSIYLYEKQCILAPYNTSERQ